MAQENAGNGTATATAEKGEHRQLGGKYLTFKLADEEYGLEILKVKEIIGVMTITQVPRTPECIKGVINLRGKVIPVVDLRAKFGMGHREDTNETCIIVVDAGRGPQRYHGRPGRFGLRGAGHRRRRNRGHSLVRGGSGYRLHPGHGQDPERVIILLDIEKVSAMSRWPVESAAPRWRKAEDCRSVPVASRMTAGSG